MFFEHCQMPLQRLRHFTGVMRLHRFLHVTHHRIKIAGLSDWEKIRKFASSQKSAGS
jgi:hypothetical protein